jgi:hypothetical protein
MITPSGVRELVDPEIRRLHLRPVTFARRQQMRQLSQTPGAPPKKGRRLFHVFFFIIRPTPKKEQYFLFHSTIPNTIMVIKSQW